MAADCFELNFVPVGVRIQRHFGGTEEEVAESGRRLEQCLERVPSPPEGGAVGHHARERCFERAADFLRDRVEGRIPAG